MCKWGGSFHNQHVEKYFVQCMVVGIRNHVFEHIQEHGTNNCVITIWDFRTNVTPKVGMHLGVIGSISCTLPICESVFHTQTHFLGLISPCVPHLVVNPMLGLQQYFQLSYFKVDSNLLLFYNMNSKAFPIHCVKLSSFTNKRYIPTFSLQHFVHLLLHIICQYSCHIS